MKYIKSKLSRQLLSLIVIIFIVLFLALGFLLPKALAPVYEKNIYNYLKQPLEFVEQDIEDNSIGSEIGYLYIIDNNVVASDNIYDVIKIRDINSLLSKVTGNYGKFQYLNKTYYYNTIKSNGILKVALTNDNYVLEMRRDISNNILPIILISFLIISLILIIWSGVIVRKIEKLKSKIDNIDNDDYNHNIDFEVDDEIKSLALAIEDMRISLKNQEEYRNQMYQNISHDFKTPLTVIKSYIEAINDGIEDKDKGLAIIDEQTLKLEQKVHSLLYLNKLDYIKDCKNLTLQKIDINNIINASVSKFKLLRKDVKFTTILDMKTMFLGTEELWETITDNILGNFIRYAEKEIKITTKKDKIVFYNDGPNIDKDFLESMFIPFRKGIKGEFGLGLSIVKKTVNLVGYDIIVKNNKKGVSYIISKRNF